MKPSRHELAACDDGSASLRDLASGETMHSSIGPWNEAMQIYVQGSLLEDRLRARDNRPLRIWDVGMGIAANALAAISLAEKTRTRSLELWSFENDLSGIRLALEHNDQFPWLDRKLVDALLEKRHSSGQFFNWHLLEGDFFHQMNEVPSPGIIFYDFYSPGRFPSHWSAAHFLEMRKKCADDTLVITYTAATPVRVALLLAGFFVGRGSATAAKKETTIAAIRRTDLYNALGREWLDHFLRSSRKTPIEDPRPEAEIVRAIQVHPQFSAGISGSNKE